MATDYGSDFSTYPDLNWGRKLTGPAAVLEAIARSLEDAQKGVDLRQWLNAEFAEADVYNLEQAIVSRCVSDERVLFATVEVTAPRLLELEIAISVTLAEGPFRLVLRVTQLGVQVLRGN